MVDDDDYDVAFVVVRLALVVQPVRPHADVVFVSVVFVYGS